MTWEVREERQTSSTRFTALREVKPIVDCIAMEQYNEYSEQYGHAEQNTHKWDIRDRVLPEIPVGEHDVYNPWPNGSCRHAYDGRRSADASHHASGWAMRNTNNHNAAILKKSCLGLLVCSRRCSDVIGKHHVAEEMTVNLRPAICDKARRKQIGASCPTSGCSGILELRRCHGHAGYPVTHFWRTQGDTIFFQAKGFHDHPIPNSWKTPVGGNSDKKLTKKTRKRRKMTSSSDVTNSHTGDLLSKSKRIKTENAITYSPAPLSAKQEFGDYTNSPAPQYSMITSLPEWRQFNSCWVNAAAINDNRNLVDANSLSWQQSSWQPMPEIQSVSPLVDAAMPYAAVTFQQQPTVNSYYSNDESEDTGYCRHATGCRRSLFQITPCDKGMTSFSDVSGSPTQSTFEPQMFPSPPPSSITTADSFTTSPPEAHFDDYDFLPHLRACADSDDQQAPSVDRYSYTRLHNVDAYPCRMMSGFLDRQQCIGSSMTTGNVTNHRRRCENGDEFDDVLSIIMADHVVMGGNTFDLQ